MVRQVCLTMPSHKPYHKWAKVQAYLLGALAKLLLSVFLTGLHTHPRAVST